MSVLPPLASAAELAGKTGLAANDPRLVSRIAEASARFREAVLHNVTVVDDVVELDGSGSSSVLLPPPLPIASVASVKLHGRELVYRSEYSISKKLGVLRRLGGIWPNELEAIEVRYTHGFNATPASDGSIPGIPDGIQQAVLSLAEALLNTEAGIAGRTVLGDTVQFGTAATVGVTQQWSDVVANYKLA